MGNTGLFHKLVTGGVILSIAAAIGVAALTGGPVAGAVLVVIVAAGWMVLMMLHERAMRRYVQVRAEQVRMQLAEIAGDLGGAFDRCADEFKSQLAIVRGELDQVQNLLLDAGQKLVGSFTSINAQMQSQQQLIMAITSDRAASGSGLEEAHRVSDELTAAAAELAHITLQMERDVSAAVTALQFQDIVTQLLGHVGRRADVLSGVADKIGALAGVLAAEGGPAIDDAIRTQGLRRVCEELAALAASVHQATIMNPVRQTSMATGEVEMF